MIRLTVLYNLPPDDDENEFLQWRLGPHQASNLRMRGVLQSDFAITREAWPEGTTPPYRFMTTAEWPDWDSFRKGFYDPEAQAKLKEDVKRIRDYVFLVSEILASGRADNPDA